MKYLSLSAALLLALTSVCADAQVTGTHLNVPTSPNGPGGAPSAIFLNTTLASVPPPGTWITVDVTQMNPPLPANTVAVNIGGFLIITNGQNTGTSDLTLAVRAWGDTQVACGNYISQTIAINPPAGNGSREQANIWVALNQGKFEYCWQRGIVGTTWPSGVLQPWPTDPGFALNFNVEAWLTP